MVAQVSIHSDLRLLGALILDKDHDDFPLNPKPGTLLVKGLSLYAYLIINGYETWFPLVRNMATTYVHTQNEDGLAWTIQHDMSTTHVWYLVQNEAGVTIYPSQMEVIDPNNIILHFTEPAHGTAVLVGSTALDVPEIKAQLISVGGGNVTIDTSGVAIAGDPVLTASTVGTTVEDKVNELSYTKEQLYTQSQVNTIVEVAVTTALAEFKSQLYAA
jgi:hypothetical protein